MADRLFDLLTMSEQIVVLLDEFDEMGRDRARSENLLSRFITTAMLPKLASINGQRKIVFLLATNFIRGFDAAFSRGGRFDMLIQVMPPTADEKLRHWPILQKVLALLAVNARSDAKHGWVSYCLDCDQLASNVGRIMEGLAGAGSVADSLFLAIESAHGACILSQCLDESTWKETCPSAVAATCRGATTTRRLVRGDR